MANTLTATLSISGQGTFEKDTDITSLVESFSIGSNDFDSISTEWTNGTGSVQANSMWTDERTLANAATDSLDLAGGLTDAFGATITFTVLKCILIAIDAPDGTKALRVGPNNVANAFQGPFGAVTANVYVTVMKQLYIEEPYTGWTVTPGTGDLLVVNNSSGVSVIYRILLLGEV